MKKSKLTDAERSKKYYQENKDKFKEYRSRPDVKEKARLRAKEYRKNHSEEAKEAVKKSKDKKKDKYKSFQKSYKARKMNAFVEDVSFDVVFKKDKGKCYICGIKVTTEFIDPNNKPLNYATLDHVIPLNKGGLHCYDNVRLACYSCNGKKSDNIPKEGVQISLFAQPEKYVPKVIESEEEKAARISARKKAYMKKWREENKESQRIKDEERRKSKRPENWEPRIKFAHLPKEERKKIYYQRYQEKNKDEINKKSRERRAKNKELGIKEKRPDKEYMNAYYREYYQKNLEKKREFYRERYKRKKALKNQNN